MDFLTIIVRARNEPFLEEFIAYYLREGASKIYVLDDHSHPPVSIPRKLRNRVSVLKAHRMEEGKLVDVNALYSHIRMDSEWFALLDADEFVTARRQPRSTICDVLKRTFSNADCVKIPWVMMAGGGRIRDPESLLSGVVERWNHDAHHPHPRGWHKGRCRFDEIEVKSAFRSDAFSSIDNAHCPRNPCKEIACVESVYGTRSELNSLYKNLRERDIANGHLLCYHFRLPSFESCCRKAATSRFGGYRVSPETMWLTDYSEIVDPTLRTKWQGHGAKSLESATHQSRQLFSTGCLEHSDREDCAE